MKPVKIFNASPKPVLVPARAGFSVVLAPGELGTVCPEGRQGQQTFWKLMSRGHIGSTDARSKVLSFSGRGGTRSHYPTAA